jgi:hypothetical protein
VKERARKAWEIISREEGGRASRLAFVAPVLVMRTPSWERLAWVHSEGFVHHGASRPLNERRRGREKKNSEKLIERGTLHRWANAARIDTPTPGHVRTTRALAWQLSETTGHTAMEMHAALYASEQCIECGASCAWVLDLRGQIRTYCRYVLGSSIVAYQSGGRAWPAIFGFSESKAEAWSWDNVYP